MKTFNVSMLRFLNSELSYIEYQLPERLRQEDYKFQATLNS